MIELLLLLGTPEAAAVLGVAVSLWLTFLLNGYRAEVERLKRRIEVADDTVVRLGNLLRDKGVDVHWVISEFGFQVYASDITEDL